MKVIKVIKDSCLALINELALFLSRKRFKNSISLSFPALKHHVLKINYLKIVNARLRLNNKSNSVRVALF